MPLIFDQRNHSSVFKFTVDCITMKFAALVLLAFVGAANAGLQEDFQEIIALVPVAEIKEIFLSHYETDADVQAVVAWLQGPDFRAMIDTVRARPEYQQFITYLENAGVNIEAAREWCIKALGIESTFDAPRSFRIQKRSFHEMWDKISALIPTSEIMAMVQDKRQTSPDFQELWGLLSSDECQSVVGALIETEEWQNLVQKGRDHGAPVDLWINTIRAVFGWTL